MWDMRRWVKGVGGVKSRAGFTGNLSAMQGICLATSPGSDGSSFTHYDADNDGKRDAVLVQSAAFSPEENYAGYSTPFPLIDSDGTFHLFYDVAQYPEPDDWRQVALAHSVGPDAKSFEEVETDIFVIQDGTWLEHEVRAPCVLEEDGILKMWFAGTGDISLVFQPGFVWGIGYASYGANCE